ncbi:hypothetical protein AgCh_037093 [Apium graveolens]
MVVIKVVRGVEKYREAAMIEVDVLQQLGKNKKGTELSFLKRLNHPNVVKLKIIGYCYNCSEDDHNILVLEYMPKGSLEAFLLEDDPKNGHLRELEGAKDRLMLCIADLLDYESLSNAISGCDGVFHYASPVTDDHVLYMYPNKDPDEVINEDCWSDLEFCKSIKNWYCYGKAVAEKSAWEEAKQRGVDMVVTSPVLVLGPLLQPTVNSNIVHILKYLTGSAKTYVNSVCGRKVFLGGGKTKRSRHGGDQSSSGAWSIVAAHCDKPLPALNLLNHMKEVGIEASVLHFTTLIDGLSRAGNLHACKYFFTEMTKYGCSPDVVPNVFTYNSMIRGMFKEVCLMLEDIESRGCNPNFLRYNTMVSYLRNAGKLFEANEITRVIVGKGRYVDLISKFKLL